MLRNAHISEYKGANQFNHHPTRPRKLLLNRSEINKLIGKVRMKGYTLVPLSFYLNDRNLIKVELGLAKGKKQHDKRAAEKEKDWQRNKERMLKE
jgi:SsrA-binding protein